MALTTGPDIDYVKVKDGDEYYYLAKARLGAYYKKDAMPEIVAEMKGADLKGMQYEPLFPYFADYREAQKKAAELYADRERWNRMSLINIANSGIFSADRSIADYATKIWHASPVKAVKPEK